MKVLSIFLAVLLVHTVFAEDDEENDVSASTGTERWEDTTLREEPEVTTFAVETTTITEPSKDGQNIVTTEASAKQEDYETEKVTDVNSALPTTITTENVERIDIKSTVATSEPTATSKPAVTVTEEQTEKTFTTEPTATSSTETETNTQAYVHKAKDPEDVVDTFFYELRKNYKAIVDPFQVPDRVFAPKIGWGIFSVNPQYRLTRCKVYGLSTIKRTSFFSEIRKPTGRQLSGMVHVPNAITKCDLQLKVLKYNITSHVTGHADNGNILAAFEENYETGKVTLKDLSLKSIGKLEFQLPSRSIPRVLTNKILALLSGLFQPIFENYFKLELSYIAKVVSAHVDNSNL